MGAPNIKRGEVYYIRYDDSIGAETAAGRPLLVISSDIGNKTSGVVSGLFLTTSPRGQSVNVEVNTTKRKSWVMCNQIGTFDKIRFGDHMCTLSPSEMQKVDQALAMSLGLNLEDGSQKERHEEEIRDLMEEHQSKITALEAKLREAQDTKSKDRVEADLYKKLYEKVLEMLTERKIQQDISPKISEEPKKMPEEPVVEPEEPEKVNVNRCSENDLIKIGLAAPLAKMVIASRPFMTVDDLRMVHGMTGIAYQVLRHKVTTGDTNEFVKPKPKKDTGKVNVNTATAEEIHDKSGVNLTAAYGITGYRRKHGLYKTLDDLLQVKRFSEGMLEKYRDKLEV